MNSWPDFLWATDIHLDTFTNDKHRRKFLKQISDSKVDHIFITGDISTFQMHRRKKVPKLLFHLQMISEAAGGRRIFFVLGNHDYWYSSIEKVRTEIQAIENPSLVWLGSSPPIILDEQTALVGHDGWYDGRNGAGWNSRGRLNDWHRITEFLQTGPMGRNSLFRLMEKLSDDAAMIMSKKLPEAIGLGAKKILILTHFPPWEENAAEHGKIDPNWVAFYSSRSMGITIREVARAHPDVDFLVLCGHSHAGQTRRHESNLVCLTGRAQYGMPRVQPSLQEILSKPDGMW